MLHALSSAVQTLFDTPVDFAPRSAKQTPAPEPVVAPSEPRMPTTKSACRVIEGPDGLRHHLNALSELIANITEAYSATIFINRSVIFPGAESLLEVGGAHTLSRSFNHSVTLPFGSGLVGWVAQSRQRVSVSPFQHDARTLLYYSEDQGLKTFLAHPIVGENDELLGVIACDSKKNYAFPQMAEKFLIGCAEQVRVLIALHRQIWAGGTVANSDSGQSLENYLEQIRSAEDEPSLFQAATNLPESLVRRESLVVLALSEGGVGEGVFYSHSNQQSAGNRLLDIVCKHKRIICGERRVVTQPGDDPKGRAFLSVPFQVLGREAGSFNLLSNPNQPFSQNEIETIEKVGKIFGRELERIRLKHARSLLANREVGLVSWHTFLLQARLYLRDASLQKSPLALVRLRFAGLTELEEHFGLEETQQILENSLKLFAQVKRNDALVAAVHGPELLVLAPAAECDQIVRRYRALLVKTASEWSPKHLLPSRVSWGKIIADNLTVGAAAFPRDGETVAELTNKALQNLAASQEVTDQTVAEGRVHAGNR